MHASLDQVHPPLDYELSQLVRSTQLQYAHPASKRLVADTGAKTLPDVPYYMTITIADSWIVPRYELNDYQVSLGLLDRYGIIELDLVINY